MKILSNILLVSGSGRNTGKTSFACSVINHFNNKFNICAIKISSHIHKLDYEMVEIFNSNNFKIFKEENRYKEKPCPSDFPVKLRKYWKSSLQYSHTPIQSGWIMYYSEKK